MVMLSDGACFLLDGSIAHFSAWTEVEAPGFSKRMNSELLGSISEIRGCGSDVVCMRKSPKK